MRFGGVDPSILRELSGVYKPFVKAFKELISNAFDADASRVGVAFEPDLGAVSIEDDGVGMSPFDFRSDFTRIGGSSRRSSTEKTRKGRLRIGSKGIGFLAMARYCDRLRVESSSKRSFKKTFTINAPGKSLDIQSLLGVPLPRSALSKRMTCIVSTVGSSRALKLGKHYHIDPASGKLTFEEKPDTALCLEVEIDCRDLTFTALLDFQHLLKLADAADLEALEDFATIEVAEASGGARTGTRITADHLKHFVRRELKLGRRKGYVRNIASRGGLEQFIWQLSRCTPVAYVDAPPEAPVAFEPLLTIPPSMVLQDLSVRHGEVTTPIRRPLYPFEAGAPTLPPDMVTEIQIDEAGLRAHGFLAAYESVVFPAEYRGVSVRVRGVAIGDPGFLGAEHLVTGANKAALSQITGEIIVERGLDAVDTLNPGRESFYEESEQFKVLRKRLLGEGEHIGGYLAQTIAAVLRRSQVRSALKDALGRAYTRRRALDDVSAAVTQLLGRDGDVAGAVRKLLKAKTPVANGLSIADDYDLAAPNRIGGFPVTYGEHLEESATIDHARGQVVLDRSRPEWDWRLLLHSRPFSILHKRGRSDGPLAEMDLKSDHIYVNWGHPIKQQMDERGFLRFSLAWVLAREAGSYHADGAMDLALHLLSFAVEGNG